MINSRKLEDLELPARNACNLHVAGCRVQGIELLVTSTWRDLSAQDALYQIGRTIEKERRPVTNARAGKSWHNFKCAWDVVPLQGGKAIWEDDILWREIIRIGKAVGAEAGAEWKTFPDRPHFQLLPKPAGVALTLEQAMNVFQENGTVFI